MFEQNSFDLLLISFVFYICNSLEKQTENSGVLLNCLNLSKLTIQEDLMKCYQLSVWEISTVLEVFVLFTLKLESWASKFKSHGKKRLNYYGICQSKIT